MATTAAGSARRAEILQRAASLFATHGVQATTMVNVGKAVGVQKASLYYFFASKEDLVAEIVKPAVASLHDEVARISNSDAAADDKLVAATTSLAHAFETYPDEMVILVRERLRTILREDDYREVRRLQSSYTDHWQAIVTHGQETGIFRQGDSRLLTYAMIGSLDWMYAWYEPGEDAASRIGEAFARFFLEGLREPAVGR
jgi:TetR/AcrR family transcriptional regulator, cholesterol catabolism regulator